MAKAKADSRAIASANSGPYVPPCLHATITDPFGRIAIVDMQPLTVGMMLHIDQIRVHEVANAKGVDPPNLVTVDQLRYSIIKAEGEAFTGPPVIEEVTVQGERMQVPTRGWLLKQPGNVTDALVIQMFRISKIAGEESLKVDFT